jgi:hypothetical protein
MHLFGGITYMKISIAVILAAACLGVSSAGAQQSLTMHTDQIIKTISTGINGQFLEHIFNSVHGGLWGYQILNGTLELAPRGGRRGERDRDAAPAIVTPRNWEFVGDANEITMDRDNPFNAEVSVRIVTLNSDEFGVGLGICQHNIALKQGEQYTLSLYARGNGSQIATFQDEVGTLFSKTFTELTQQWQEFTIEFTSPRNANNAALTIRGESGPVNVDQISLFSASALASGGDRPDLFKAIADLKPASIRWPGGGGSFANHYIWQNAIDPREKRFPHPSEQVNDRDTYQFGTDEFIQFCEKVNAEPILVLNTSRGVEDALNWLEYCMGDTTTEYDKMRAANGHPAPYVLKTLDIDNEPWLMMQYPAYLERVKTFCPALFMRKQGVTTSWDNALINFDQKSWFPGGNYVVMKLWPDSFARNLLTVDGPDRPLNFVATRSADKQTVFLKAVNPINTSIETTIHLDGDMSPRTAATQMIAP